MSRPEEPSPDWVPLLALVHRLNRALQQDMVREAHQRGHTGLKNSHNAVFATLDPDGSRAADMAAQTGMTRQSMGEIVRDLVGLGMVEMVADPADGRAKLVRYTEQGLKAATEGFHHIQALERSFVEEFGEEDYATARRVLERVTELLEAQNAEPAPRTASAI